MVATFDPVNKYILLPNVVTITAQSIYNDAMDWADEQAGIDNDVPMTATGFAPLGGGAYTDKIFVLANGWKLKPFSGTYTLTVIGTIITDDGSARTVPPDFGTVQIIFQVTSQGIITVSGSGVLPQDIVDIADAVWNETSPGHTDPGKAGAQLWTVMDAVGVKVAPLPADPASNTQVQTRASQTSVNDAQTALDFLRRFFTNKKVWDDVNKRWDVYDDAGVVILFNWKPRTKTGTDVTMPDGAFANSDKVA